MAIARERGKHIFRKTERELLRLSSKRPADTVHSFRTTTRRLQTLLQHLMPTRDRNQKKLLKMLNRIRKLAGRVRDLDVQLAALRSLKVAQEPRRKTQLTQSLIDLRAEDEKKLGKLMSEKDIRELRKRLKRASKDVRLERSRDPLAVAKEMLASIMPPAGVADEDILHRYRIIVKRARYAAEFAPKSAESTRFIAQLKTLQDALGNWHDWLTLTQTAAEHLGEMNQSPLVAALHSVTRSKFRNAVAAVTAARSIRQSERTGAMSRRATDSATKKSSSVGRREVAA